MTNVKMMFYHYACKQLELMTAMRDEIVRREKEPSSAPSTDDDSSESDSENEN